MAEDLRIEVLDSAMVDREAIRRECFALWAWEMGRNCAKLRRWLIDHRDADIPERTLQYWCKADGWVLRYERDRIDIDPLEARPAIALRLQSAAMYAAQYIEGVASGSVDLPIKERLQACKIALDAVGFSPTNANLNSSTAKQYTRGTRTNFKTLDTSQLQQQERLLRLPIHVDVE